MPRKIRTNIKSNGYFESKIDGTGIKKYLRFFISDNMWREGIQTMFVVIIPK